MSEKLDNIVKENIYMCNIASYAKQYDLNKISMLDDFVARIHKYNIIAHKNLLDSHDKLNEIAIDSAYQSVLRKYNIKEKLELKYHK